MYFILATSMFGVSMPAGLRLRVRVRASVGMPAGLRLRVRVRASVGMPAALRLRVRVRASVGRSRVSVVAGLARSRYLAPLTWAPAWRECGVLLTPP